MPENQAETLKLLLETGRLLSAKLDLDDLLAAILELCCRVVDSQRASVLLLDAATQELYFHTALGLGEEAGRVRVPLGQGIAGSAAKNRKPEIINDVRRDPRWSPNFDRKFGFSTRSILAAPMLLKGRLVGVIEALNKRSGEFSAQDLSTLEAFASQAAVAIDNATLVASLKEEQRKLNLVFSEMTDGALLADRDGRVVLANDAARKLFAVGGPIVSLAEAFSGMELNPSLAEIMSGPGTVELAARRLDPQLLIMSGQAAPVSLARDRQNEAAGRLLVLRDVTEETQNLALKRTFLSLISHKLRTPLAAVMGFADVLRDEFERQPPSPPILKAVQTIAVQSKKLAGLVDKLLHFATLESPETKPELGRVSLDEVVAEALQEFKHRLADGPVAVRFQPAGLAVTGDRKLLGEAVKNLVENAVKFADKPQKRIVLEVAARGESVELSVRDNGPGIPPEEQDRVFSLFHQVEGSFTGQIEGWGLGLPYVRKVAELHGGSVSLVSRLGEGTTVTLSLPGVAP